MSQGKFKWRNDAGPGTATITWKDAFTGEVLYTQSISGVSAESSSALDIPYTYTVELTAVTGTVAISAGVDGDSGDRGKLV